MRTLGWGDDAFDQLLRYGGHVISSIKSPSLAKHDTKGSFAPQLIGATNR